MDFVRKKLIACACAGVLLCVVSAGAAQAPEFRLLEAGELKEMLARGEAVTILDVRSTESYLNSDARIRGAQHVRLRRLRSRLAVAPLKDAPRDREVVAYCACPNDEASYHAAQVLRAAGFKRVSVLKGGWQAWLAARGPVDSKPAR